MSAALKEPRPARVVAVFKPPKTLGACADLYFTLREQRLAAQKIADAIEVNERAIREHIILTLPKSEASGVAGKLARVSRVIKQVPQIKDWSAFYAYIKKTGSFDLLQRRPGEAAIQERWDAGKVVPGVESFTVVTLSVSKVK